MTHKNRNRLAEHQAATDLSTPEVRALASSISPVQRVIVDLKTRRRRAGIVDSLQERVDEAYTRICEDTINLAETQVRTAMQVATTGRLATQFDAMMAQANAADRKLTNSGLAASIAHKTNRRQNAQLVEELYRGGRLYGEDADQLQQEAEAMAQADAARALGRTQGAKAALGSLVDSVALSVQDGFKSPRSDR